MEIRETETIKIMERWVKSGYTTDRKNHPSVTPMPAPRGRGIVILILLALLAASVVFGSVMTAKVSQANSRNISMMKAECADAVALCSTLSRTASTSSAGILGKIRADVHAIDVINDMKMLQDGENHAYVSSTLIDELYTIMDAYSNTLITGMSTVENQTSLSNALQELSTALSGL